MGTGDSFQKKEVSYSDLLQNKQTSKTERFFDSKNQNDQIEQVRPNSYIGHFKNENDMLNQLSEEVEGIQNQIQRNFTSDSRKRISKGPFQRINFEYEDNHISEAYDLSRDFKNDQDSFTKPQLSILTKYEEYHSSKKMLEEELESIKKSENDLKQELSILKQSESKLKQYNQSSNHKLQQMIQEIQKKDQIINEKDLHIQSLLEELDQKELIIREYEEFKSSYKELFEIIDGFKLQIIKKQQKKLLVQNSRERIPNLKSIQNSSDSIPSKSLQNSLSSQNSFSNQYFSQSYSHKLSKLKSMKHINNKAKRDKV